MLVVADCGRTCQKQDTEQSVGKFRELARLPLGLSLPPIAMRSQRFQNLVGFQNLSFVHVGSGCADCQCEIRSHRIMLYKAQIKKLKRKNGLRTQSYANQSHPIHFGPTVLCNRACQHEFVAKHLHDFARCTTAQLRVK